MRPRAETNECPWNDNEQFMCRHITRCTVQYCAALVKRESSRSSHSHVRVGVRTAPHRHRVSARVPHSRSEQTACCGGDERWSSAAACTGWRPAIRGDRVRALSRRAPTNRCRRTRIWEPERTIAWSPCCSTRRWTGWAPSCNSCTAQCTQHMERVLVLYSVWTVEAVASGFYGREWLTAHWNAQAHKLEVLKFFFNYTIIRSWALNMD